MQAVGMSSALTNQPLEQMGYMMNLLQPFQQRADLETQAQYQEFLRTAPENNPFMRNALAFLGTPMTAQTTQPGWGAPVFGMLGGALTGGLLGGVSGAGVFSDMSTGAGALYGGALGGLGGMRF
jgi:uncharacterized protein YcfJ